MERRLLFAIVLMMAVLMVPSLFMKRRPAPPRAAGPRDSVAATQDTAAAPRAIAIAAPVVPVPTAPTGDTVTLMSPRAAYRFATAGATLEQATLADFRTLARGDSGRARLLRPGERMLGQRLIVAGDTIALDSLPYTIEQGGDTLRLAARAGPLVHRLSITAVSGNPYLLDVQGEVVGLEGRGATLLLSLGTGFANVEADSNDNYRHYAVAARRLRPENVTFRSVDPGAVETVDGPFDWVGVKSKYFLGVVLSADSTAPAFGGAVLIGGPRNGRTATHLQAWVTSPVRPDGRFRYQVYLGPQEYRLLHPMGRDLDRASPYGWIFRPIVMPVATWVTQFFLFLHENLRLSYGWILVLFGVMVRVVLWPLNQRAMKSQVAMMAVQPLLQDIQKRYKNDPQKLQTEMMKVYKEHKVNPFGGCLPLLVPMPVLLALFFVFANTIELRGTPFLWLPDLSLRDPLFVTPLVMGLSMFVLSKMSQRGMPPNPQTQMMTVVMPVMMTVLFLNFASGLNLYYAVSNLVSLPQQWLINKARMAEMARRQVSTKGAT